MAKASRPSTSATSLLSKIVAKADPNATVTAKSNAFSLARARLPANPEHQDQPCVSKQRNDQDAHQTRWRVEEHVLLTHGFPLGPKHLVKARSKVERIRHPAID